MKITVSLGPEKLTLDVSQNSKIQKFFFYSPSFAIVVMDFLNTDYGCMVALILPTSANYLGYF